MTSTTYTCSTCGKEHEGLPSDWGFKLPDEVHALSYIERYKRAKYNADLCTLDEQRHFIRGVLPIPLVDQDDTFGWGIWAEVNRSTHDAYVEAFNSDAPEPAHRTGVLVNHVPGYSETSGLAVGIQFNAKGARPTFTFATGVVHGLAHEQLSGISQKRHHDILETLGFFDETDA